MEWVKNTTVNRSWGGGGESKWQSTTKVSSSWLLKHQWSIVWRSAVDKSCCHQQPADCRAGEEQQTLQDTWQSTGVGEEWGRGEKLTVDVKKVGGWQWECQREQWWLHNDEKEQKLVADNLVLAMLTGSELYTKCQEGCGGGQKSTQKYVQ